MGNDNGRSWALGIDGTFVDPNLVVQMRPRRMPAVSGETYGGTLIDPLSSLHDKFGQVTIEALNAVPVLKNDRPTVPGLPPGETDDASRRRSDRRSDASADIDAGVNVAAPPRRASCSEPGIDRSPHRPVQPQRSESVAGVVAGMRPVRRGPSSERDAGHDRHTYQCPARQMCSVHGRHDDLRGARVVPVRTDLAVVKIVRTARWLLRMSKHPAFSTPSEVEESKAYAD